LEGRSSDRRKVEERILPAAIANRDTANYSGVLLLDPKVPGLRLADLNLNVPIGILLMVSLWVDLVVGTCWTRADAVIGTIETTAAAASPIINFRIT
jgi:hypothetical protein